MTKIEEAQKVLKELGLPDAQQNEISGLTLLALCQLEEKHKWSQAHRKSLGVSKGIMAFMSEKYEKNYAPNTRETVRRQVLHQFLQAGIADYNPDELDLPVNSPRAHYAISELALKTIKCFKTRKWRSTKNDFISQVGELKLKYQKERELLKIPVKFPDGRKFMLSPGKHNEVQAAVIHEFAPRFVKNAIVLYLGDTEKKDLHIDKEFIEKLSIRIDEHSKLPDVVLFDEENNWLFLIEAVTSHGPISPKRIEELNDFLKDCSAGKIYITAFPDFSEFRKHTPDIAWETEVWIMEMPDHMIHYNGDSFLRPRES